MADRELSRFAATDSAYQEREGEDEPDAWRSHFERDVHRVLFSLPFRRLRHKTQVFLKPDNDHIGTRLEHALNVQSISDTIARNLHLDTDLVAAIAYGHDVGHAPFGHRGGEVIDEFVKEKKWLPGFSHEAQSLRVVDHLAHPSKGGLNLTFGVRDGIVCHCGEAREVTISPARGKRHDQVAASSVPGMERPATLEGCVVRMVDRIAYLGRDLEDAITAGIIPKEDAPALVAPYRRKDGSFSNGRFIGHGVSAVVGASAGKDEVSLGDIADVITELTRFNYGTIYHSGRVRRYWDQVERMLKGLLGYFREKDAELGQSNVHDKGALPCETVFLEARQQFRLGDPSSTPEQIAVDFISGMTDNFAIRAFEELFVPRSVDVS
jgi:dGTPase